MTRRFPFPVTLVLLALATGCVSKKDHASLQTQLDECQRDKRSAQDLATNLQKQLGDDEERWSGLQATMSAMPDLQKDFEEERRRILSIVPTEIRAQVGDKLDRHFANVTTQLTKMREDVAHLDAQLTAARDEIVQLRGTTEGVSQKVDTTNATLSGDMADLQAELARQRASATDLVRRVTEFDATFLNCDDCEERLRMKEKSREALRALHGELVAGLSALQASGG